MEPLMAEIKLFGGNFAPQSWLFCDGSLLPISQYTALFSLLGTTYGGDGMTTFALPDLRGRAALHSGNGQGPGLSAHPLGEEGGSEANTLNTNNLAPHIHNLAGTAQIMAKNANGDSVNPANGTVPGTVNDGQRDPIQHPFYSTGTPDTALSNQSIGGNTGIAGGNSPIPDMQPYLGMNYIICFEGIYPQRP
ncbi:MAG: phage tail protein [Chitinophagaceae bacterium]|nr:MAG: phage tail protein [Chitinophagaceae bacterium]